MVVYLLRPNRCKNYNLNVTEIRDFKNAFHGIFNFTVGILVLTVFSLRTDRQLETKWVTRMRDPLYNILARNHNSIFKMKLRVVH